MQTEKYNKQNPLYEHRVESQRWADSFHGKIVSVNHCMPGVAISCINPGGWGYIKLYTHEFPPDWRSHSYDTLDGKNYLTSNYHWALYRDLVKEVPLSQMIMHRLKGDALGELMAHVK